MRFGACPSVSYIDASGRNCDRLNEYPWLVTTVHANRHDEALFATISRYLSFYGFGSIAEELGLLEKYGIAQHAAATFFYDIYTEGNEAQWRDAVKIYRVLGAHLAMLAYEIQRDTPVSRVTLLGSRANHLDAQVFGPIWDGFAGFIDRYSLPFADLAFDLAEDVSDKPAWWVRLLPLLLKLPELSERIENFDHFHFFQFCIEMGGISQQVSRQQQQLNACWSAQYEKPDL